MRSAARWRFASSTIKQYYEEPLILLLYSAGEENRIDIGVHLEGEKATDFRASEECQRSEPILRATRRRSPSDRHGLCARAQRDRGRLRRAGHHARWCINRVAAADPTPRLAIGRVLHAEHADVDTEEAIGRC
jgi:hypothetical protein